MVLLWPAEKGYTENGLWSKQEMSEKKIQKRQTMPVKYGPVSIRPLCFA